MTFYAIKTRSLKKRKIEISLKGYSMVLVKKWPFLQLFFFSHYRVGEFVCDILERENDFLGYKNKKFEKSKN